MAVRAAGDGLHAAFIQFMKSGTSGEVVILRQIPGIHYFCPGKHPFILTRGPDPVHYRHAQSALDHALDAVERDIHIMICDEILNTLIFNILPEEAIRELMEACRGRLDLVMTGRHAPDTIVDAADYVTEFVQVKHPYYKGVRARRGIEY